MSRVSSCPTLIWTQLYNTSLWRRPGFFQVEVKGLKVNRHQSSRVRLMHTVDSLAEPSGWASRDSILTKQITIWHKAPTATHICLGCAEKQRRNTTASKHPETQQSLTLYLSRLFSFFSHSQGIQSYSQHWVIKQKNSSIWYSDILLFLFILKRAFVPSFPIHIFDWCKHQTTIVHFEAGLCREPWGAVLSNLNVATNC